MGEALKQFVNLAYEWHGGGSSSLYVFASNKGTIQNITHAFRLKDEINHILDITKIEEDIDQFKLFLILIDQYIKEFEHGAILKGGDQYRNKSYRAIT
jgi:hypothetical protein